MTSHADHNRTDSPEPVEPESQIDQPAINNGPAFNGTSGAIRTPPRIRDLDRRPSRLFGWILAVAVIAITALVVVLALR